MAAYCFFNNVIITDSAAMNEYSHRVFEVVQKFGGEYVVIGGPFEVIEGHPKINFPVMIKFPSLSHAKKWYASNEYGELMRIRKACGEFDAFFMEGID